MEIALEASLNQKQVDALLDLIGCVAKGAAWVTLKNDVKFCKACDAAVAELTLFSKHTVVAAYKKEVQTYEVHDPSGNGHLTFCLHTSFGMHNACSSMMDMGVNASMMSPGWCHTPKVFGEVDMDTADEWRWRP
ncbi:hypothetical protein F5J12DRAFT_888585 [Pisolithus orientalis]|uniref:uncharacterized protein n=1 Tax=Pisolithus orientalis TaxID=936130 RepID=UPI0022242C2B|nr:uncharacterized protein F5J12DRAFT_888585 [Pisolithus orientalis]KAI6030770.1 hypothetical protein F5J12DRAFT_888585 [Pisolithus orientalis]